MQAVQEPLLTGTWGDSIDWEFYTSTEMPPVELCTSVMCVAMTGDNTFVLTHNHRGWELPGGHIEPGETVEAALERELMEEAGYVAQRYQLFGYRKLIARSPIPHAQQDGFYPFPMSYMPYYVATSDLPLHRPTGDPAEILGAQAFTSEEANMVRQEFLDIVAAGRRHLSQMM